MRDLVIESTQSTPKVVFTDDSIKIEGELRPEFPYDFFEPIHQTCSSIESERYHVICVLEFISSSSLLQLKKMLKILADNKKIKQVNVTWNCLKEDDEMQEIGEYLSELSGFPFKHGLID